MPTRAERHTCHADGCEAHVPPAMFMCRKHWYMLPKALRDAVWGVYAPGQEDRMDPSDAYIVIAQRCVNFVAVKEGRRHVGTPDSGRPGGSDA